MPHYGRGCRISTLIMVPINFWRNSDLFKKKNIFLAQKLTILELFKENLWKFSKKISQTQNKNLWNLFGATLMILSIKLNNFGSTWLWNDLFGSKCHIPMFQSPVWGGGVRIENLVFFRFFKEKPKTWKCLFGALKDKKWKLQGWILKVNEKFAL